MGTGEYAFPGGHVEYMESLEKSARRETLEECGIEITNVKFMGLFNLDMYAPKHYIGIGFTADWKSGEPQVLEPEKCVDWNWYEIDKLPQPIFKATELMVDAYLKGYNFHDI
jgi:8-oxo-dGTP diphosphatase